MLAPQFSLRFQPGIEGIFWHDPDQGFTQDHIMITLGLIIGIQGFLGIIQGNGKKADVAGFLFKFDKPFMGSPFFLLKINRSGRIF